MERRHKVLIIRINGVVDLLRENESLHKGELKENNSMVGRRGVLDF